MKELRIDWLRCDAHGVCAEVAPELFTLDDWGYPIVSPAPLTGHRLQVARRAARLCPALALSLARDGARVAAIPAPEADRSGHSVG